MTEPRLWKAIPDKFCFNLKRNARPGKHFLLIFSEDGARHVCTFIPVDAPEWPVKKLRDWFIGPMIAALEAL